MTQNQPDGVAATALAPDARPAETNGGRRSRKHDPNYKWVALSNTTLGVLMSAIDGSIVIISLPGRNKIDILVAFTDHEEPFKTTDRAPSEGKGIPKEKVSQIILLLIKEIIKKYKGLIGFDIDEKGSQTLVSLRLPVDRRQVIYYDQLNL